VLDRGAIVEEGVHDDLIRAGGLYSRLHQQSRVSPDGFVTRVKADGTEEPETSTPVSREPAKIPPPNVDDLTSAQR
jgi:hypothetical protein